MDSRWFRLMIVVTLALALGCSEEASPCDEGEVRAEFDGLSGCYAYCDDETACAANFGCQENVCRCTATICENQCVDLSSSKSNCGECGNECRWNAECVDGACDFPCGQNGAVCDDRCVSFLSDPDNCGKCGRECLEFQQCRDGFCR